MSITSYLNPTNLVSGKYGNLSFLMEKPTNPAAKMAMEYFSALTPYLATIGSAYALGKACKHSETVRNKVTQGALISGSAFMAIQDPLAGGLSFSSTLLGTMQLGAEDEVMGLSNKVIKGFGKTFNNSEFVGQAFAKFSDFVDYSVIHCRENAGLPLLVGISTSLLLAKTVRLDAEVLKTFDTPFKSLGTICSVIGGAILAGQSINAPGYGQLKHYLVGAEPIKG